MTRSLQADAQRYEALKREIAALGLIRRGTLLRRFLPCGKSGCRCQARPPRLHGPYYQWTRKVGGKTITLRIRPDEAKLLAGWIENGRRLNRIVRQLERIALRLTERLLRAVRSSKDADAPDARRPVSQPPRSPMRERATRRPK